MVRVQGSVMVGGMCFLFGSGVSQSKMVAWYPDFWMRVWALVCPVVPAWSRS